MFLCLLLKPISLDMAVSRASLAINTPTLLLSSSLLNSCSLELDQHIGRQMFFGQFADKSEPVANMEEIIKIKLYSDDFIDSVASV